MGFFSNYGVDAQQVSTDPFSIPRNTYRVSITECGMHKWKADGPEVFRVELTITDGEYAGRNASQSWNPTPQTAADHENWQANNARSVSSFKAFLLGVGIPAAGLDAFDPSNPAHTARFIGLNGTAEMFTNKSGFNSFRDFATAQTQLKSDTNAPALAVNTQSAAPETTQATAPDAEAISALLGNYS